MIPQLKEWAKAIDAAEDRIKFRCAFLWLCRWAGAGFGAKAIGDVKAKTVRIVVANGGTWKKAFPDGPGLIEVLRPEISRCLETPGAHVLADPERKADLWATYTHPYYHGCWKDAGTRLGRLRWVADMMDKGTKDVPADKKAAAETRKLIPAAEQEVKRFRSLMEGKS